MLYRQRLQVERDLRAGAMAGDAVVGAETPGVGREGVARRARGPRPARADRVPRRCSRRPPTSGPPRRSTRSPGRSGAGRRGRRRSRSTAAQEVDPRSRRTRDEAPNGEARPAAADERGARCDGAAAADRRRAQERLGHLVELPARQIPVAAATRFAARPGACPRRRAPRPRPAPPRASSVRPRSAAGGRRPRRPRPAAHARRRARTRRGPGSCRRPRPSASSPSVPRTICSWSLVSSRQTAAGRSAPQAAARSRSVAATRPGASNSDRPRGRRRRSRASRSRRSRPERGRNPSNDQRGPATPLATTAASTADAPGIGTTRPPSPAQAATRSAPGSLTDGRAGIGDEGQVRAAAQVVEQRREPRRPAPGVVARHPRRRSRGGRAAGA